MMHFSIGTIFTLGEAISSINFGIKYLKTFVLDELFNTVDDV